MKSNLNLHKKTGMTLTELIVASFLIAIVMIGVISFNFAIKQVHDSTNKKATVIMRATSVMSLITKDVGASIGHKHEQGVVIKDDPLGCTPGNDCAFEDLLLIKVDIDEITGETDWVIYYQELSGGGSNLKRCEVTDSTDPFDCADCLPGDCPINTIELVGRIACVDPDNTTCNTFAHYAYDLAFDNINLEIDLIDRYDPVEPYHPVENPKYHLQTTISPFGHSY